MTKLICFLFVQFHVLLLNIFFIASGVGLSLFYCGHFWPIVPAPDDRWGWLWSNWWNEDWKGKSKYSEKTCPSATLSTTNPTWPDPESNPGHRGGSNVPLLEFAWILVQFSGGEYLIKTIFSFWDPILLKRDELPFWWTQVWQFGCEHTKVRTQVWLKADQH
jgi:hypothetical protein